MIPTDRPPQVSRRVLSLIRKHLPNVGWGKLPGSRIADRVDTRMHVFLCELCARKRWNQRGNDYGQLFRVDGKPVVAVSNCSACKAWLEDCYVFAPEELVRTVWAQHFGLKRPSDPENLPQRTGKTTYWTP